MPFTKSVLNILDKSTYIYLFSITQIFFRYYYSKISGRKLKLFDTHLVIDIIIFNLVLIRIYKIDDIFQSFLEMENMEKYDNTVRLKYVYLMGSFLTLLWLKLIIYLKFSITLGPLIRILEQILFKLFGFLFIFFGEIIFFAFIGNILFIFDKNSSDYRTFFSSFLAVFNATVQVFNFSAFDDNHTRGN